MCTYKVHKIGSSKLNMRDLLTRMNFISFCSNNNKKKLFVNKRNEKKEKHLTVTATACANSYKSQMS